MTAIHCDVVIIGCGPTGVVLANLLGQLGHRVAVIERDAEVFPIPRATHIDEETMRNFQTTGLMPQLLEYCTPFGKIDVVNQAGTVLFETPVSYPEVMHGYAASHFFHQPSFERVLREGLRRYPSVSLHLGCEVDGIKDTGAEVTVYAREVDGAAITAFQTAWVVGCDGGRSFTRSLFNITMESLAPKRQWMIVDVLLKDKNAAELLPGNFRYVLDPDRLTILAYGIGANRRWEFQLEEGETIPDDAEVLRWVARYIDLDRVEVLRITNYAHNALIAHQWRVGRVFVAGDAAHMMPPSAGQGLCSGVRDAINLAWKLDAVIAHQAQPNLLDTYALERRYHLKEVLKGTLFIGQLLKAENVLQEWWREKRLQLINSLPALQAFMRRLSLRRPALQEGYVAGALAVGGHHLPQVTVRYQDQDCLIDDALGYRFALLAKPTILTPEVKTWARQRGIGVWVMGQDLIETDGYLSRWLHEKKLEFVLVRPDHLIFGGGKASQLAQLQAEYDSWLM